MHYNVQFGRTILRGVGSRVALGAYDEIKNNKFLPLMKKALRGTEGTDAKTSLSLVIKKMAPLLSIMPQRHTLFRGGGQKLFCAQFCPDENFSGPLKLEFAPDKKKSWTRL